MAFERLVAKLKAIKRRKRLSKRRKKDISTCGAGERKEIAVMRRNFLGRGGLQIRQN